MKIVALAGGVGGAKLADGLYRAMRAEDLTVIVNTGDDLEHWGLRVSPDLDTVCYTLAGLANPQTGWGLRDETWRVLNGISALGGPVWFRVGDRDLATHLERTRRLDAGEPLSTITRDFCGRWGIRCSVLPMTDDRVATIVETEDGDLPFQEYFVHRKCEPRVKGFHFCGAASAQLVPRASESLAQADAVVICPSNPWVSIDPILAVWRHDGHSSRAQESGRGIPIIGVSPLIAGKAVKGPAAKMFMELGIDPNPGSVLEHYGHLRLAGFVIDRADASWNGPVLAKGVKPLVTQTLMVTAGDRLSLAEAVLHFIKELLTS
jgi:LPPG:FO 2-phospho-L-lactate transferase